LVMAVALNACFKAPEFPITPEITFNDIVFKDVSGLATADTLILTINFKDGDGDLGLDEAENDFIFDGGRAYPVMNKLYFELDGTPVYFPAGTMGALCLIKQNVPQTIPSRLLLHPTIVPIGKSSRTPPRAKRPILFTSNSIPIIITCSLIFTSNNKTIHSPYLIGRRNSSTPTVRSMDFTAGFRSFPKTSPKRQHRKEQFGTA